MELMESGSNPRLYNIFFLAIMLFNLYSVSTQKSLYLWQED